MSRGKIGDAASKVVAARAANVIHMTDADSFFGAIAEKVRALEAVDSVHPLSNAVAIATTKKLVSEEKFLPQLRDLVIEEAERAFNASRKIRDAFIASGSQCVANIFEPVNSITEVLRHIFAHGCFWAGDAQCSVLAQAIQNLGRQPPTTGGKRLVPSIESYPALPVLYAGGVSAVANDNYEMLYALYRRPTLRSFDDEGPFLSIFKWHELGNFFKNIPEYKNFYSPVSEYMFRLVRPSLTAIIPDELEYADCFDRFEYFLAVEFLFLNQNEFRRPPVGRWLWREKYIKGKRRTIAEVTADEAAALADAWPPIRSGLFGGTANSFEQTAQAYRAYINQHPFPS